MVEGKNSMYVLHGREKGKNWGRNRGERSNGGNFCNFCLGLLQETTGTFWNGHGHCYIPRVADICHVVPSKSSSSYKNKVEEIIRIEKPHR